MIQTGFWIGERDWWIMANLNIKEKNLGDIYNALMASGCPDDEARHACMVISRKNRQRLVWSDIFATGLKIIHQCR
jgi:hypothetical protein